MFRHSQACSSCNIYKIEQSLFSYLFFISNNVCDIVSYSSDCGVAVGVEISLVYVYL